MQWERETYFGSNCCHPHLCAVGWSQQRHARRPALVAHDHEHWELCVIEAGEVWWWVENERVRLPAGSVYVTRPGETHGAVDGVMHPCVLWWCQIAAPATQQLATAPFMRTWIGNDSEREVIERMLGECRKPDIYSGSLIGADVARLVTLLRRSMARAHDDRCEPVVLQRLREQFQADPSWWPSIEELAAAAGIGKTWLHTLCQQHWQEPPLTYAQRLRIRAASQRLLASSDSITAIAHDLAYASSQHFATAFKRFNGMSPRAYRREHMDG